MSRILRRGRRGTAVQELQALLNKSSRYLQLVTDSVFGPATENAVRAFQRDNGLVVDGAAGPQTMTALRQAVASPQPGRPEPDKSAMSGPVPIASPHIDVAALPPNVATLKLLDTARQIDEIFIHCAATPEGRDFTVADIRAWHKQRGWSDIGYHYVVYRDGSVHLGRPVGQIGAHAAGHNAGSIGICYVGGVAADGKAAKDTRTLMQRSALLWLTKQLIHKHHVKRVRGHSEVAPKACPSFSVRNDALGKLV